MTLFDPNLLYLHLSKISGLQIQKKGEDTEIKLWKQSFKKVGGKTILIKNELDLTLQELEILSEAIQLLQYFLTISQASSQGYPPKPPPRVTSN